MNFVRTSSADQSFVGGFRSKATRVTVAALSSLAAIPNGYCAVSLLHVITGLVKMDGLAMMKDGLVRVIYGPGKGCSFEEVF